MEPDRELIERTVRHLGAIERPSASAGEREAAEWIAERLREEGLDPRLEEAPAHGGYWWPLGIATGAAALAGLAGRRRRSLAVATGVAAAAAVWDELVIWRHWTRRLVGRRRTTTNVVAEAGDRDAAQTVLVIAHHDAAHAGVIFHPAILPAIARAAPWAIRDTSPPLMWVVFGGPLLVAAGAATGVRALRRAGTALALASLAAFADIGARGVVPGANDNLSAVAVVLALARALRAEPVEGLRVLLVSTGGEEAFEEGMQGFARRWWPQLPQESTRVLIVECVGGPQLAAVEREGMLKPYRYDAELKDLMAEAGAAAGVPLRRGIVTSFASDGLIAVRDGYRTALLGSVSPLTKAPPHYHWPTDDAEHVDYDTIADAVRVIDATVRRLAAQAREASSSARAAATAS